MVQADVLEPIEELRALVKKREASELSAFFDRIKSHEVVHLMNQLDRQEQMDILTLLQPEDAAGIVEEIPEVQAAEIVDDMDVGDAAAILNELPSDEQADILSELDREEADEIIAQMRPEEAADVRKLIKYDSETAGGLMITEYLAYQEEDTVGQVTVDMRRKKKAHEKLHIKYIYVLNEPGQITGVLRIQDLLLNVSSTKLREIITRPIHYVDHLATLEDLQNFFHDYDYYSAPVVDPNGFLLGVVLRKDLLEAVAEHTSLEHLETQGIVGGDELRTMPVWTRASRRLSWLSVNILLNILAASVIAYHQDTLSAVIALAVFLPIISDMSGCSGNQAIAVSMRELSLGTVKPNESIRVWMQELSVGLINGVALGILIGLAAFVWKGNVMLGIVVGAALSLNTLIAVSLGGTVPLILKYRGIDPALASGPLLTTVTDMAGFFLTLSFASLAIQHLNL